MKNPLLIKSDNIKFYNENIKELEIYFKSEIEIQEHKLEALKKSYKLQIDSYLAKIKFIKESCTHTNEKDENILNFTYKRVTINNEAYKQHQCPLCNKYVYQKISPNELLELLMNESNASISDIFASFNEISDKVDLIKTEFGDYETIDGRTDFIRDIGNGEDIEDEFTDDPLYDNDIYYQDRNGLVYRRERDRYNRWVNRGDFDADF